jgi:uracil-DNA glycosylase
MNAINIEASWKEKLQDEFEKPYFQQLKDFLIAENKNHIIYPKESKIFAAFQHTPWDKVKVVLIGQDPYHGEGQANGLSFSVNDGIRKPPSLQNIFKELESDLGYPIPSSGNLENWAKEGILLLNATLTVRSGEAGSHQKKGWEEFTDNVIRTISTQKENIVFLLWGNFAQTKANLIDAEKHKILKAAHPSPLARGAFFGCKHFSKTNDFLKINGLGEINWKL